MKFSKALIQPFKDLKRFNRAWFKEYIEQHMDFFEEAKFVLKYIAGTILFGSVPPIIPLVIFMDVIPNQTAFIASIIFIPCWIAYAITVLFHWFEDEEDE